MRRSSTCWKLSTCLRQRMRSSNGFGFLIYNGVGCSPVAFVTTAKVLHRFFVFLHQGGFFYTDFGRQRPKYANYRRVDPIYTKIIGIFAAEWNSVFFFLAVNIVLSSHKSAKRLTQPFKKSNKSCIVMYIMFFVL